MLAAPDAPALRRTCVAAAAPRSTLQLLCRCCQLSIPFRCPAVELMKPGSYVTLRNAKVDMFRGSMRLAVNQVGAGGVTCTALHAHVS